MTDSIIFEKSDRQTHAAQGESYANYPGYHIWIQYGGTKDSYYLAYVEERLLDTALWFYMQETDLNIVIVDNEKQIRYR